MLPPDALPPSGTHWDEFVLEPLRTSHVALDYDAVMETRTALRRWSASSWPADDFTLEENLQDLAMHSQEHDEGVAFTYTILSTDRSTCLGCVYIKPLFPLFAQAHEAATGERPTNGARVTFWVRESSVRDGLDTRVLRHLMDWFADTWPVDRVVYFTSDGDERHQQLFEEAGLVQAYAVAGAHARYLAYL